MTRDDNLVFKDYLEQFHELPRLYIKEGIRYTKQQFDHRFGVYHDLETESFSIGDSILEFDSPDIGYTNQNEKEYFNTLKSSNALYTYSKTCH